MELIELSNELVRGWLPMTDPAIFIDTARLAVDTENREGIIDATYIINPSYPILPGHFPGRPVFRGVDTLECMAQASMLLGLHLFPSPEGCIPNFEGVKNARFIHNAKPGDVLKITSRYEGCEDASKRYLRRMVCDFTARVERNKSVIAEAWIIGSISSRMIKK